MYWTAVEYAAHEGLTPRCARARLTRWYATGVVRVLRETIASTGREPPRTRYLLDVEDWKRACGIVDDVAA